MAYDPLRKRIVLYGLSPAWAEGGSGTWGWNGSDWQQMELTVPCP